MENKHKPIGKFRKTNIQKTYTPYRNRILRLENGYYLLYYHRQAWYTMFLLYLKYLIPLGGLIYLIRKNPCKFYIANS